MTECINGLALRAISVGCSDSPGQRKKFTGYGVRDRGITLLGPINFDSADTDVKYGKAPRSLPPINLSLSILCRRFAIIGHVPLLMVYMLVARHGYT